MATRPCSDHCYIEERPGARWAVGRRLTPDGEMVRLIQDAAITEELAQVVYGAVMNTLPADVFVKALLAYTEEQRYEMLLPVTIAGRLVTFAFIKLFFEALHPERQWSGGVVNATASIGV